MPARGTFLLLWCTPSLHPVITFDCNLHLSSNQVFTFCREKNTFQQSHFNTAYMSASVIYFGFWPGFPGCSHSIFLPVIKARDVAKKLSGPSKRPQIVYHLLEDESKFGNPTNTQSKNSFVVTSFRCPEISAMQVSVLDVVWPLMLLRNLWENAQLWHLYAHG